MSAGTQRSSTSVTITLSQCDRRASTALRRTAPASCRRRRRATPRRAARSPAVRSSATGSASAVGQFLACRRKHASRGRRPFSCSSCQVRPSRSISAIGGRRPPGAGGIGPGASCLALSQAFADRVDPRPGRLDFVAAHEQRLVAADDIDQQPLIGLGRALVEGLRRSSGRAAPRAGACRPGPDP